MRLSVATLCDAATVRDGLLNVIGAGISAVWRPFWPAPFSASLAVMIDFEHEEAGHQVAFTVIVRQVGAAEEDDPVAALLGSVGSSPLPGGEFDKLAPQLVPIAIPLDDVALPGPGAYEVVMHLDDTLAGRLVFIAREWPIEDEARSDESGK